MGQSASSTAYSDIIQNATTNVLTVDTYNCAQNNTSVQTINLKHLNFEKCPKGGRIHDLNQTLVAAPNLQCIASSINNTDIVNQISAKLDQEVKAQNGVMGSLFSSSKTNAINKYASAVNTNVQSINLSSCFQNNMDSQLTEISDITYLCEIDDINQSMVNSGIANCIFNNKNIVNAKNELAAELSQSAKSTNDATVGCAICCIILLSISILILIYYMSPG